jgi:hypothetical protein
LKPAGENYRVTTRFGSLADITSTSVDVRFTPQSGHYAI